jgi:hypothetical protein
VRECTKISKPAEDKYEREKLVGRAFETEYMKIK